MSECWIGIGANLGDSRATFDVARAELARLPDVQILNSSGLYHTAPVGQHAGGVFSNAVFSIETTLDPYELLDRLQAVESLLGRTRDLRWGPRALDLDLLFFGDQIIKSSRLTVPHPAAWYRRFVVDPLVEVAPTFRHPVFNQTIGDLRTELIKRPLVIACRNEAVAVRSEELQNQFPDIQLISPDAVDHAPGLLLKLTAKDWPDASWNGKPVVDLMANPGDAFQRVVDFLSAALDSPTRVGDW